MTRDFLIAGPLPFCRGCGHHLIVNNTEQALQRISGLRPLDVVLVTDIGCHGIIDRNFCTHTIHGLHGRSIALAAGISAGLDDPNKKVLVYIGDGGATIGLQHLLEAAHRNFNMTVIIHNNMLYGMTGGQPSGLTPGGFKTRICMEGQPHAGYDLCRQVNNVGASYARRVIGSRDFSGYLEEAIGVDGFSLLEVMEVCPSYGAKHNPGRTLTDIVEQAGLKIQLYSHPPRVPYKLPRRKPLATLLDGNATIARTDESTLAEARILVLSGSAGEGVQSAAGMFAHAAVASGLNITNKGSYPVTVGIGFSASELIVSPEPILFTGVGTPDVMIITSQDGLDYSRDMIGRMGGTLIIDASLEALDTAARIIRHDFRNHAGARSAALFALFYYLNFEEIFPLNSLTAAVKQSKLGAKIDVAGMMAAARGIQ